MRASHIENERVNKIQEIAFELFLEKGYGAANIRTICKKAEIEQPTLYYYFGSKKGLFFSIAKRLWDNYNLTNHARNEMNKHMSPDKRLFDIFLFSVNFATENRQDTCFFLRFSLFPPVELKEEIQLFFKETLSYREMLVKDCMNECILLGLINKELQPACDAYWRFVNNNIQNIVFTNWQPSQTELKELWDVFFQFNLKGLWA